MYVWLKQLEFVALLLAVISATNACGQVAVHGQLSGYPSVAPQTHRLRQTPLTPPTVSPYLHLTNQPVNSDGSPRFGAVYQVLVRPQIEQRQFTLEQEREIARIQSNMLQIQNQLSGQVKTGVHQTGHQSRFMSLSHFYPQVQR